MDGDSEHPHYHYGGMWKNKHEAVSAKKPKSVGTKNKKKAIESENEETATINDNERISLAVETSSDDEGLS